MLEGMLRENLDVYLKSGGSTHDVVKAVFDYFGGNIPKTTEKLLKIADYGQLQLTQKISKWKAAPYRIYTIADVPNWAAALVGAEKLIDIMAALTVEPVTSDHFAWYDGVWHFDARGYNALALRCYGVGLITMEDAFRWLEDADLKEEECEEDSDAV